MNENIQIIILAIFSTLISMLLSYDFLIEWAAMKGLFFTPIISLSKIDFILTSDILWSMPLSQMFYSIFSIIQKRYIFVYLFLIYMFYYIIPLYIIKKHTKNNLSIYLFSTLSIIHIYIYRFSFDIEQLIYSTYIVAFVFFFYLKEEKNSPKNAFFMSLLLGITFMIRSSLLLLPVLLSLYELLKNKNIKNSLIILIVPYLTLIPWSIFSYYLSAELSLIEKGRINLNLITTLYGITHTVESNKQILVNIINKTGYKDILSASLSAVILRIFTFIKIYHIFFVISLVLLIKERKKFSFIVFVFSIIFLSTHILFSIEKRYLFPCGTLFLMCISLWIKEQKQLFNINQFFISIITPYLIMPLLILRYIIINPKEYNFKYNVSNIISSIEKLYYNEREDALKYLKDYLNKKEYLYTNHISEVLSIINGEIPQSSQPSLLFNTKFIVFLKLISDKNEKDALSYLKKNWHDISSSYLRDPLGKWEEEINIELQNYIKENSMTYPSFVLVSNDIKEIKEICVNANSIIKKAGKKHQFDCNIEKIVREIYIRGKCLGKKYTTKVSNTIFEIIRLESEKKYDDALTLIEKNLNKEIYKFYLEKGNILYLTGKYNQAKENFLIALELCPCAEDAIYGIKEVTKKIQSKEKIKYPSCQISHYSK